MGPETRHSRRRPEWASSPQPILPETAQALEKLKRQAMAHLERVREEGPIPSTHDDPTAYIDSVNGAHALNARVTSFDAFMKLGVVCDPPKQPVVLGWGVAAKIHYEGEAESMVVLLASPLDVAYAQGSENNFVSIDGPAGTALLGKGPGETVTVCVEDKAGGPAQPHRITVEAIIPYREYVQALGDQTSGNK